MRRGLITGRHHRISGWRGIAAGLVTALLGAVLLGVTVLSAADRAKSPGKGKGGKGKGASSAAPAKAAASALPALKTPQDKLRFLEKIHASFPARHMSTGFTVEELDRSLKAYISLPSERFAPLIDDEGFARRIHLDLTGDLPEPGELSEFVADAATDKRARLIDRLLDSPEFSRHWARYWREVLLHKATANRRRMNPQALEDWLADQFSKKVGWDRIVCELVSATPRRDAKRQGNEFGQNHGPNNFVLAYENDPGEIASQTARIFMGISIQCAECHDHPFDKWKREQYHEMAAFFAPGKYHMPDLQEPSRKTEIQARFLLGEKPPEGLKSDGLRVAVAAYLVYNPDNYWFARAFVNRIWSELLGDGFYSVDSLGPDKDCVYPLVVNRMGAVFRYKDFDIRWVFRTIANSQTYQRASRSLDDPKELFTAVRPSRLRPEEVVQVVEHVTGELPRRLERSLEVTFDADPSAAQQSLEGSLQQALLLMNDRSLHAALVKSRVRSDAVRAASPDEALDILYVGILARHPTADERRRGRAHLSKVPARGDAIDDLLWVLVNSTEFLTRR
ncbi:MAG: DUF1549 domain-containing protein [Pirellulales bacterium]